MLTQAKLSELLTYNPETGVFKWNVSPTKVVKAGDRAGSVNCEGYVTIGIKRTYYQAHQLAWLYMTGTFISEIDHIDGDRTNNTWSNLREVVGNSNRWNRKLNENSTTKVKGVYWNESNKGYTGSVSKNKQRYSRTFKTLEEAEAWVYNKRIELHSEYARHR